MASAFVALAMGLGRRHPRVKDNEGEKLVMTHAETDALFRIHPYRKLRMSKLSSLRIRETAGDSALNTRRQHVDATRFAPATDAVIHHGDCLQLLERLPDGLARLIVTSPPYNIGKRYERRMKLDDYLEAQAHVIAECVRVLADDGSICWQVGNYVDGNQIIPLDIALWPTFKALGLKMRNRIVWHFEHGLHCSGRFSGRYETIIWFTKSDSYIFNLDDVRVPQKYPGKKHFKGPKAGQYSCNPLGKNPGDLWIIPNVKHNHVEKTIHPCQFPIELVERLILAMTNRDDWVLDPYMGVGTTLAAAIRQGRRGIGAELLAEYVGVARQRIAAAKEGTLRTRPMDRPVYVPTGKEGVSKNPFLFPIDGPEAQ